MRPAEFRRPSPSLDVAEDRISHGYGHYKPGRVGPVYTFVKTNPYAHVKWGVRHVVGKQYAGSGHH